MSVGAVFFQRFLGAEIEEREVDGKMQKCISIPLEMNAIMEHPKYGLCMYFYISETHTPHMYAQREIMTIRYTDKAMYFKLKELGLFDRVKKIGTIIKTRRERKFSPKRENVSFEDALKNKGGMNDGGEREQIPED